LNNFKFLPFYLNFLSDLLNVKKTMKPKKGDYSSPFLVVGAQKIPLSSLPPMGCKIIKADN